MAIDADKRLFLNGVPDPRGRSAPRRSPRCMETKKEKIVLIKGDVDAPYSAIMGAMDRLRAANIENIGLITERKVGTVREVSNGTRTQALRGRGQRQVEGRCTPART